VGVSSSESDLFQILAFGLVGCLGQEEYGQNGKEVEKESADW
jgi:hypothetical protein